MTLDLGNGNSITLNTFHNKLWITTNSSTRAMAGCRESSRATASSSRLTTLPAASRSPESVLLASKWDAI
jgi:hypothetical protein